MGIKKKDRSSWKGSAILNRDARHDRPDDAHRTSQVRKKDTKRWCKGKVGREHEGECRFPDNFVPGPNKRLPSYRILVCKNCGKHLDFSWNSSKNRPDWVKF